jgi:F-type H+-transporting ATPase subunit delta
MAYTSVLAKRYAEGLLRVARESGQLQTVAGELHTFAVLFEEGGTLREIMLNPAYSAQQRRAVLEDLQPRLDLSETTLNFLRLLIKKRRIDRFEEIVEAYDESFRRELGVVRAEVTVAEAPDTAAQAKISQVVAKVTGKTPELLVRQDGSIIGGMKIRMGNTILDASIKTKLERLRETLLEPVGAAQPETNS